MEKIDRYVIQIKVTEGQGLWVGWLAKSFRVRGKYTVPATWDSSRVQIVTENGKAFKEIVKIYKKNKDKAPFSYDESTRTLSCSGAVVDSWIL